MMSNRFYYDNEVIITGEEIRQILLCYNIGKKPLAKLLGWGETTIIRYMEGDIPTSEYSYKLKTLLYNPQYYFDLLVKRKDCLTNVAFKKSKKAALSCIMKSKIYAVTYYIINKIDGEICPSFIQYLLYYIQSFSLALYDQEMFQDDYSINNEKMPYINLYRTMKRCGIRTLELEEGFLDDQEVNLIDKVFDAFSWYGPKAIKVFMEIEAAELTISRDQQNNLIIPKKNIMEYFKILCDRYGIMNAEDIKKYPDHVFLEIHRDKYECK